MLTVSGTGTWDSEEHAPWGREGEITSKIPAKTLTGRLEPHALFSQREFMRATYGKLHIPSVRMRRHFIYGLAINYPICIPRHPITSHSPIVNSHASQICGHRQQFSPAHRPIRGHY
jgi:hypothetical protein